MVCLYNVSRLYEASEFSITVESQENRRAKRHQAVSQTRPSTSPHQPAESGDSGGLSRSAGNPVEKQNELNYYYLSLIG